MLYEKQVGAFTAKWFSVTPDPTTDLWQPASETQESHGDYRNQRFDSTRVSKYLKQKFPVIFRKGFSMMTQKWRDPENINKARDLMTKQAGQRVSDASLRKAWRNQPRFCCSLRSKRFRRLLRPFEAFVTFWPCIERAEKPKETLPTQVQVLLQIPYIIFNERQSKAFTYTFNALFVETFIRRVPGPVA